MIKFKDMIRITEHFKSGEKYFKLFLIDEEFRENYPEFKNCTFIFMHPKLDSYNRLQEMLEGKGLKDFKLPTLPQLKELKVATKENKEFKKYLKSVKNIFHSKMWKSYLKWTAFFYDECSDSVKTYNNADDNIFDFNPLNSATYKKEKELIAEKGFKVYGENCNEVLFIDWSQIFLIA